MVVGSSYPSLWPYQQKSVDEARQSLNSGKRVMLQCPTGGGKTEMAIVLVKEWLERIVETGKGALPPRVLWLTHREELRRQTGARFKKYGVRVFDLSEAEPKDRRLERDKLCIVSAQIRQLDLFAAQAGERDLLIADEAHHTPSATWKELINRWPGAVLGLTATPWRLNEKEGFQDLFDELVVGPSIDDLRNQGHLADYVLYAPKDGGTRVIGRSIRAGDYSAEDIDVRVLATDRIIEMWEQHKPKNPRTVWYVPTTNAANQLSETLKRSGFEHVVILAETDPEVRRPALARFSRGEITHVINVMTLMEGIDVPEANCIVLARPTKSLVVFLQAMGRGLRPQRDKKAVLIDLGHSYNNLYDQCGKVYPFGDVAWSLAPRGPRSNGDAPMKDCPCCDATMHTGHRTCPGCGLTLGEECIACRRFTFYTNSGYGGEDRLFIAVIRNQIETGHSSAGNTYIGNLPRFVRMLSILKSRIRSDGGFHCADCAEVSLIKREFRWEIGPVNGYKAIFAFEGSNHYSIQLIQSDGSENPGNKSYVKDMDSALAGAEHELSRFAQAAYDSEKLAMRQEEHADDVCIMCKEMISYEGAGYGGEERQLLRLYGSLKMPYIVVAGLESHIGKDGGVRCRRCAVVALRDNRLLWNTSTIHGFKARMLAHKPKYSDSRVYRFDVVAVDGSDSQVSYLSREWSTAYSTLKRAQAKMKALAFGRR